MREVLLTLHILSAVVLIGWLALHSLVVPGLIRGGPANANFVRTTCNIAMKAGPATIVVFVLGLWLVFRDGEDAIDISDPWVSASMLVFIVTSVLGGAVAGRTAERAAAKLEAGETALDEARTMTLVGIVNFVLLVVIVWLMVDKPGLI